MAVLATVTFTWEDDDEKTYNSSYTHRTNNPSDGDVQDLAGVAQGLTALSLIKATVTREVDITGESDAPEAGSSRQRDASLVYRTSVLRASRGKRHTFTMPQFKAALLNGNGEIDPAAAIWDTWTERFDDGAGIAGIQGGWFAGNQGELIEDSDPLDGYQNKN